MKKTYIPKSVSFRSILLLLALLALIAFPTSSAWARPKCDPVDIGTIGWSTVTMSTITPTPCKILFTTNGTNPTHDASGNPTGSTLLYSGPFSTPLGTTLYKAMCWKAYPYADSIVTELEVQNPPN